MNRLERELEDAHEAQAASARAGAVLQAMEDCWHGAKASPAPRPHVAPPSSSSRHPRRVTCEREWFEGLARPVVVALERLECLDEEVDPLRHSGVGVEKRKGLIISLRHVVSRLRAAKRQFDRDAMCGATLALLDAASLLEREGKTAAALDDAVAQLADAMNVAAQKIVASTQARCHGRPDCALRPHDQLPIISAPTSPRGAADLAANFSLDTPVATPHHGAATPTMASPLATVTAASATSLAALTDSAQSLDRGVAQRNSTEAAVQVCRDACAAIQRACARLLTLRRERAAELGDRLAAVRVCPLGGAAPLQDRAAEEARHMLTSAQAMVINTVQTNVQTSPPRASARAALSACTAFVESVARLTGDGAAACRADCMVTILTSSLIPALLALTSSGPLPTPLVTGFKAIVPEAQQPQLNAILDGRSPADVQREARVADRLASLEQRQREGQEVSEARFAALEASSNERFTALEARHRAAVQQLQGQVDSLTAALQQGNTQLQQARAERDALQGQVGALEGRMAAAVESSQSREGLEAGQRALSKKLAALERSSEGLGHSLGLLTQQAAALDQRHTEVVLPRLEALHEAERTWAPRLQQLVGSCEQLQNDHLAMRGSVDAAAAAAAAQLQRQLGELRGQVAQGEEGQAALSKRLDKAEWHLGGIVPWVHHLQAGDNVLAQRMDGADGCLHRLVADVQRLMGGSRQQQLPGMQRAMSAPAAGGSAAVLGGAPWMLRDAGTGWQAGSSGGAAAAPVAVGGQQRPCGSGRSRRSSSCSSDASQPDTPACGGSFSTHGLGFDDPRRASSGPSMGRSSSSSSSGSEGRVQRQP